MMNAHPYPQPDYKTPSPMDESTSIFKDIAQRSLNGELLGHMAGFMYDDSCPEQGYVGGAKKWSDFVKKTKKYKFLSNDEMLLKNNAEEMAAEVIGYREGDHHLHLQTKIITRSKHLTTKPKRWVAASITQALI